MSLPPDHDSIDNLGQFLLRKNEISAVFRNA